MRKTKIRRIRAIRRAKKRLHRRRRGMKRVRISRGGIRL